jgi:GH25 family lysozyme M1 (1,4-beta-N-acetylmuramidase)
MMQLVFGLCGKPGLALVATLSAFLIAEPALAEITGPDVSSWQHPGGASINWSQVKADGRPFVFVKATEDTSYTNPYFAADWSAIKAAGMYRGPYHFAQPSLPASTAFDQASHFGAVVGNLQQPGDLPPVLDLEVTGGLSPAELVNWTHIFLSRVQYLTGRTPMIYTSPNFWTSALGGSTEFTGYPLWIARWTSAADPYPLPGGWATWTFWQYTDAGSIPGITGNVDVSRFNGDSSTLTTFATTFTNPDRTVYRTVGRNQDGRLEAFAVGADKALWRNRQSSPGIWGGWVSMGGSFGGQPVVLRNLDGRLEVYAFGTDGTLYGASEGAPNGSWSGLGATDALGVGQPAAAPNADGRQQMYLKGTDGNLWTRWQTSPNGGWSSWTNLGGPIGGDPAVGLNSDGRDEVFVRGTDGAVWTRWQMWPNGAWSQWASFGGTIPGRIAVSSNGDGRLELFVRGMDNNAWTNYQTRPSGNWSGWQSFGGQLTGDIGTGPNADGRQQIFARNSDGAMWTRWQTANGNWSSWLPFGGGDFHLSSQVVPDVAADASGALEVFNLGNDSAMWRNAQTAPNGNWTEWQSLGGNFISP